VLSLTYSACRCSLLYRRPASPADLEAAAGVNDEKQTQNENRHVIEALLCYVVQVVAFQTVMALPDDEASAQLIIER